MGHGSNKEIEENQEAIDEVELERNKAGNNADDEIEIHTEQ